MKVSIITPSYNSKNYMERCIETVRNQVFGGTIEHIVVDGGSKDGTVDIFAKYPHLKWISEPDRGMYDAINKGIRLASGEILAYLNVDDQYFPGTVAKVVEALSGNSGLDFVYGYCEYVDGQGRPLFTLRPLPFVLAKRAPRILWAQPTFFWRKRICDDVGLYDPTFRHCGDTDFVERVLLSGKRGKLIRSRLARFMLRQDCITANAGDRLVRERAIMKERYLANQSILIQVVSEVAFALLNLHTYPYRLPFRRLILDGCQAQSSSAP